MALIFNLNCTLKCLMQIFSIWTSLKFCCLVIGKVTFILLSALLSILTSMKTFHLAKDIIVIGLISANQKYLQMMIPVLIQQKHCGRKKENAFLAHLSTTCSRGVFRVVQCLSCVVLRGSSTISLNIFSSQTTGQIWTKLGRNVP